MHVNNVASAKYKNVLSDLTKSFSFCGKELNIFESNLNFCSVKFSMNCIFTWLHLNIWNISILFLWTSKTNHLHKLILHLTVYHWMVSYLIFVRNARNAVSVKFLAECKKNPEQTRKLLLWAPFVVNLRTFRVQNFQDSKCVSVKKMTNIRYGNDPIHIYKIAITMYSDYIWRFPLGDCH